MKKLAVLFSFLMLLFAGGSLKVQAENIKFVQITDTHLTAANPYTSRVLESAVEDINKQPEISFVVFTGDNIAGPKEENLRAFMKVVKKLKVKRFIKNKIF